MCTHVILLSRRAGRPPLYGLVFLFLLLDLYAFAQQSYPFRDPSRPASVRVGDLLTRLTLEEKISLLGYESRPVARLGIPAYNWWNEALHGVARAGEATVFPQAIGLAATFNDSLLHQVASAISTEARAKYNLAVQSGQRLPYRGLTFWSPNINIFRDPRWGRGQETYGEDPYLSGRMGTAFVQGMQGSNPEHLKTAACAKHFAVHSGPERGRSSFNAVVDPKDLRETYLPAFHQLVRSGVEAVMGAYNRVNGEPCNTSVTLLGILRREWGFRGHLVTDCGALDHLWRDHRVVKSRVEAAAAAIRAGVNLDCSDVLQQEALRAVGRGLLREQEIDSALAPLLRTQVKLGLLEDPSRSPYAGYGADSIRTPFHLALARQAAVQSMVLLKNDRQVLPLQPQQLSRVFVTGSNAFSADALLANYHGISPGMVTFAEGITAALGPAVSVQYETGCDYTDTSRFGGLNIASGSDVTVAVIGLTPLLEGEEGDAFLSRNAADKQDLRLPPGHVAFLRQLRRHTQKPVVAVVTAGSAVDIADIEPYADAIILSWYPGEQGGHALADILLGKVSPSGRLPVTFYQDLEELPAYTDYRMQGRTYRYFSGKVLYPFGYGLSYTSFAYRWKTALRRTYAIGDTLACSISVTNTGKLSGDEVVQAYVRYPKGERMPIKELKQFQRVSIPAGGRQEVCLRLPVKELQKWDLAQGRWKLYPGTYTLVLGGHSADDKLTATFTIK